MHKSPLLAGTETPVSAQGVVVYSPAFHDQNGMTDEMSHILISFLEVSLCQMDETLKAVKAFDEEAAVGEAVMTE